MNINCLKVYLKPKDSEFGKYGHERNLIYIQDEKYNIDGVYYFDVTWDSKRNNEKNEFLNRYKYFAKTRAQMIELEEGSYIDRDCPYYSFDMLSDIKKFLNEVKIQVLFYDYIDSLNYMSRLVDGNFLINKPSFYASEVYDLISYYKNDEDNFSGSLTKKDLLTDAGEKELFARLKNIEDKFNRPITAETFIRLFNNVKKIQYYENSEFYSYSIDGLFETYNKIKLEFFKTLL